MKFHEYAVSKAITLCFLVIGIICFIIYSVVIECKLDIILMSVVFIFIIVISWLICGYTFEKNRIDKLMRIQEELDQKFLLGEVLPKPVSPIEKRYYEMMKAVSMDAISIAENSVREKNEYCEYVESWIHEIKTPLTACSLILANGNDIRRLKHELKRADNLTEAILYYARLRTTENDNVIKEFSAADVINKAVKSQMEILIAAKISVETSGDFKVSSDENSVCFMLKQLLINCAKYCPGANVKITAENGSITVLDNGIGIPSYDIPRLTDRGFTGTNGRKYGGSTGMGLYIVKELGLKLDISISISSKEGEYTSIQLSFDNLTKL